jgi:hypothetical protein
MDYWFDSECYGGVSDEPRETFELPSLGMEVPCMDCPLVNECGFKGVACKGYRNWVNKGKYEDGDIGSVIKILK